MRLKLYFTKLSYKVDLALDITLSNCLKTGIKTMRCDRCNTEIEFYNGVKCSFYSYFKYSEWISEGYIGDYRFNHVRPSRKNNDKNDKAISKYILTSKIRKKIKIKRVSKLWIYAHKLFPL